MDEDDLVVPRTKSIIGTRKATRKSDVYSYGESDSETPQTGTAKRSRNTYSRKKGTKRPRRLFCSEESDDDKSDDSVINQPVTFKTGRNFFLAGEKQNCRYLMQPWETAIFYCFYSLLFPLLVLFVLNKRRFFGGVSFFPLYTFNTPFSLKIRCSVTNLNGVQFWIIDAHYQCCGIVDPNILNLDPDPEFWSILSVS